MTKKLSLEVKYVPEFEVIGLFSNLNDYRLCWFINKALNINLRREDDILLIPSKVKNSKPFSFYKYQDKELKVSYYLLNNIKDQQVLLSEPKKIDYLMLLKAKDLRIDINEIVTKLRGVSQIATAVWFKQTEKVKNLDRLLYDLEIALVEKP